MDFDAMLFAVEVFIAGLIGLGLLLIFGMWTYTRLTIILSNSHMIHADANGRLPVNRAIVESGAMVQEALGLVPAGLIRPDANGLLPVDYRLLQSPEALTLLVEYIKAHRIPANVPAHLVYSPHSSNDRALDVSLAQGMGATGGGAFKLFDQPEQDNRFAVALPAQQLELPFAMPAETEVRQDGHA